LPVLPIAACSLSGVCKKTENSNVMHAEESMPNCASYRLQIAHMVTKKNGRKKRIFYGKTLDENLKKSIKKMTTDAQNTTGQLLTNCGLSRTV